MLYILPFCRCYYFFSNGVTIDCLIHRARYKQTIPIQKKFNLTKFESVPRILVVFFAYIQLHRPNNLL